MSWVAIAATLGTVAKVVIPVAVGAAASAGQADDAKGNIPQTKVKLGAKPPMEAGQNLYAPVNPQLQGRGLSSSLLGGQNTMPYGGSVSGSPFERQDLLQQVKKMMSGGGGGGMKPKSPQGDTTGGKYA